MGYNANTQRITAPVGIHDLQQCFAVVIRATIEGQTVTRLSGDLGVICSTRAGETFTINGVTWTVVSRREINPWARYRPIPCQLVAGANTQLPITPSQRMGERYGVDPPVDMYSADDISAYQQYAAGIEQHGAYYLKLRPWADNGHWKRFTDFVKTDNSGNVTNTGYDHNARPANVKVTIASGQTWQIGEHYLAPLIPDGQRTIDIPPGSTTARYQLPNDHTWMDLYYQQVHGTATDIVHIDSENEEWLSPIDFMGTSTYDKSYASVRRRILVFRWADGQDRIEGDVNFNVLNDAAWRFYNYATDKVGGNLKETERPFSTHRNAWLDLTDSADDANCYYTQAAPYAQNNKHLFSELTGRCLFIDAWVEENSYLNLMPIVGYAYEVHITRSGISTTVDVAGVLTVARVEQYDYTENGTQYYGYQIFIDYNPSTLGLAAGQSGIGAQAVAALSQYYQTLKVAIPTSPSATEVNLLDTSLDYETDTDGAGNWFSLHCVLMEGRTFQDGSLLGATAVVTARRVGASGTNSKSFTIQN